jgi:predicted small lipoprotein YifL
MHFTLRMIFIFGIIILLNACGQTGGLYLPPPSGVSNEAH